MYWFSFFPAVSAGYVISEEAFMKKALPWIDQFKIRASYGEVGNDVLDGRRFPYVSLIDTDDGGSYSFGEFGTNRVQAYRIRTLGTPNLTWEIAKKYDVGVDFSFFNGKISGALDWFLDKRDDIFMQRKHMPLTTGLADQTPMANVGKMKSYGWEGNIGFTQSIGQVNLQLRANFTYQTTDIIDKDEAANELWYKMDKGFQLNQSRGLIALGLFKDQDEIDRSPKQTSNRPILPGDIKYKDVNGDGVVNDNDKVAIGATTTPNLVYGIGASFAWKGIDVNVHFQGAGKSTFPIYGKCVYAFSESDWGNIFKDMISDRWVDSETAAKLGLHANENPNATYPRLTYGENKNNQQTSTYWMRDGRYIRLKNLDIGYTLPKSIVNKLHFNNIRIYIAGSNLITWSKFKTWDPETGNPRGEAYPLTKSVTMGLSVNL